MYMPKLYSNKKYMNFDEKFPSAISANKDIVREIFRATLCIRYRIFMQKVTCKKNIYIFKLKRAFRSLKKDFQQLLLKGTHKRFFMCP